MSRSWTLPRTVCLLASLAAIGIAGCSTTEPYELGQPIEMGPWTFEVERAREVVESRSSGGRQKIVLLTLRLHNYTERHETNFDDFLNGNRPGGLIPIMFPNLELVHEDGTTFLGSVSSMSGGSLRSERWEARVWLIPDNVGIMADLGELAQHYADTSLSDLTVAIENPDRRPGQPRRVTLPVQ